MKPAFRKLTLPVTNSFVVKTDDMPLKNPWHYHPEAELIYLNNGHGTRFIGDSVGSLEDGDLFLIGSNLPHTTQRDLHYYHERQGEKPFSIIVQFLPDFLGKDFFKTPEFFCIQMLLMNARRGLRFTGAERKAVGTRLMQLHTLSPPYRTLELITILLELSDLTSYEYLSSEGFVNVYGELHHARLNKVYEYSVNHFMDRIPIEVVADLANLTPAAFCRFFKARTGKTYIEYLTKLRISFACKLLAEDKLNISEVGNLSGFTNISLFNRQFKELIGMTPSEYREFITGSHLETSELSKILLFEPGYSNC
jgi:AraC-like DNA-binding protein